MDIVPTNPHQHCRYVARGSSLYPAEPLAAARVDALLDQEGDAFTGKGVVSYKARFGFGFLAKEENAALLDEADAAIWGEILPRHLQHLTALLKAGGTQWLAGTAGPTIADFYWAASLESLQAAWPEKKAGRELADDFPELAALLARFNRLASVAAYYAARA